MVSVESTQGLERRMKVEIPAERVENEIDRRLKDMSRRAKIKGFRPGKVPMKVIRQKFGAQVREDVVSEMVRETWLEAITERQLRPVGSPRIESHHAAKDEGVSFTAIFEVFPEIDLKGHEGVELERPIAQILPEDVDAMIEKLREQHVEWLEVERQAGTGNRVTIDFAGTIDGNPFRGGAGEGVRVVLGEGRMLSDFENGLSGLASGEERRIEVQFPADYGSEEVAGRTAEFQVKVHKVEESRLPEVDEAFCRTFGIEEGGVERLRAEVEENMREEMNQRVRETMKRQMLDRLVAANRFEIPAGLLEREIQSLRVDMARRMKPDAELTAEDLPPREPFEAPGRFRVSLGLLIGEIVRREHIQLDKVRVQRRVQAIAQEYGDPQAVLKVYRNNPELMSQVETAILEEQVVDWLLERAQVTDKPMSFNELMNPERT